MSPTDEAAIYAAATIEKPVLETVETTLPVSGLGMAARKKALRERRALGAGEIARMNANAAAAEKHQEEEEQHRADESEAEAVRITEHEAADLEAAATTDPAAEAAEDFLE